MQGTNASQNAPALVRVALLSPMSGQSASIGVAIRQAAQMALFDLAPENLVLQPYDTKGTAAGAQEAVSLALSHHVDLIIGPVFGENVKAVKPLLRESATPMIAFTTDKEAAGNNVYIMGALLQAQVQRIVNYAVSQGRLRFAALAPDTAYGRAVVDELRLATEAAGVLMADAVFYNPAATDFTGPVKQLVRSDSRRAELEQQKSVLRQRNDEVSRRALARLEQLGRGGDVPFDAILIPDVGARLLAVSALLPYYDVDPAQVKVLGTMLWAQQKNLGSEVALRGAWYPAPDQNNTAMFQRNYEKAYGVQTPQIASLGYDAVALAAVLVRQAGNTANFSQQVLTQRDGFSGMDGLFRFNFDGTNNRAFAVMEVSQSGSKVQDPAPTSFYQAGF
jgi:ABC-type branched-subunit amino acid transport system substrate-binding protein